MAGVFGTACRCRSPLESQQQSFLTDFSSGRGIDRQTKYPYSEGPLTPGEIRLWELSGPPTKRPELSDRLTRWWTAKTLLPRARPSVT